MELLLLLCATEDQQERVLELVQKFNKDNDLELAISGAFDAQSNTFNLTKASFLNEQQLAVHNFMEVMQLRLEDPESAKEILELLLTENGHSASAMHIADECLTVAYALQTLLRYFST